jgi:hypothetical protein
MLATVLTPLCQCYCADTPVSMNQLLILRCQRVVCAAGGRRGLGAPLLLVLIGGPAAAVACPAAALGLT